MVGDGGLDLIGEGDGCRRKVEEAAQEGMDLTDRNERTRESLRNRIRVFCFFFLNLLAAQAVEERRERKCRICKS